MHKSPTTTDLAKAAGVGIATVDRVINKRAPVNEETVQRVLEAAERIGFPRTGLIRKRAKDSAAGCRLAVILQKRSTRFYVDCASALNEAMKSNGHEYDSLEIIFLEELVPQMIIDQMRRLAERCDVLAVVAADHPLINQAIDQLALHGTPVIALISDLSAANRAGYIGLDNRKVGRTAAWMMSRLSRQSGKIGLMIGSHRYQNQEENEISFRAYMRESAPEFQVLETMISLEDIPLACATTEELLAQHPDLVGLYLAGGGIEGVLQALRDHPSRKLVTICHDLTDLTREALARGEVDVVLAHPLEQMAIRLLTTMKDTVVHKRRGLLQYTLPFLTYTATNA
ncbi:LacI family DNA-binding transcriptional regulator [Pokkaliibacter sp. MBI-7]|uniref:LacI family DNA-binding transcriptional regulator n=1 Tax=Pokkaliibacter sp. MBI-7 TaxID=3040600 RepID=UPI002447F7C5|nr:LacI family DNA-binding transcriptional regulator [Pokkaliibacter sp. MBI-7]MDH2434065.1 LacI family DNA-binding transcriptional regulator [Pokkaliibacter sp. MBI-7]